VSPKARTAPKTPRRIGKILVANRGEIAVRIIRACQEMGIATVAVYSEADRSALHVQRADEAMAIGPPPSRESYLVQDRILDAAAKTGADAVHPGYGFLAENASFARACEERGVIFIGPRSETIVEMGEKTSARRLAREASVPVVPGTLEPVPDDATLLEEVDRIGLPVMLKAAAGGGGKGMRLVRDRGELLAAAERARSEARSAFGDDRLYIEKAVERPRHIEIQVLADHHGHAVHLFERECSIQRRHQKVVEESPSPFVTPALREQMGAMALSLVRRVGYWNAGTLEFLVDKDRKPYFLEMNTRLQVEHPVTEMVTGQDLVKLQIRIAQGEALPFRQEDLAQRGHAIECRVYAEDPNKGFLPSPGPILSLVPPGGPGIRDDSGVYEGYQVPVHYDPLLSKLVAYGTDRKDAILKMRRALREYRIVGIHTTIPFFERVLSDPGFEAGDFDTSFVEGLLARGAAHEPASRDAALVAAAIRAFRDRRAARLQDPKHEEGPSPWRTAGIREGIGGSSW
jgi:acetyl-CoA carboxylase biotin carboxylase subunit